MSKVPLYPPLRNFVRTKSRTRRLGPSNLDLHLAHPHPRPPAYEDLGQLGQDEPAPI